MAKKKTKNFVKYTKKYIKDLDGSKYAPFIALVEYTGFDSTLDKKLRELAERNSGEETGSGYGFGGRDITFDFFTEYGAIQFCEKAKSRYKKYGIEVKLQQAVVEYEDV